MPSALSPAPPRPPARSEQDRGVVPGGLHRWTVEEYHRLGEAGGLEGRAELIDGVIVQKHTGGETLQERRYRFTREEVERLAEGGAFEGLRVELIEGDIVDKMSPQGSRHSTAVYIVSQVLNGVFGDGYLFRQQLPLALSEGSAPEPDIAVVRGHPRDYADRHPAEAVLVVEVSDATLATDRTRKLALYARARVPEYWIVNLVDNVVEVHRDPLGETYRTKATFQPGDAVPVAGASLAVADLLP